MFFVSLYLLHSCLSVSVCGCVCFVAPTTRILLVRVVGAEQVLKSCSANLRGLDLGCIEANFCKRILVGKVLPRSISFTFLYIFGIQSENHENGFCEASSGRGKSAKGTLRWLYK